MKTLLILVVLLTAAPAYPDEIDEWHTTPDGYIVITFRMIDKDGVHFASFKHRQVEQPGKVPSCNEIQVKGRRLYLLTQEAKPMGYIVDLQPIEKLKERFEPQPKTFGGWVR